MIYVSIEKNVMKEKSTLKQLFAPIVAFVFFSILTYIPAKNQFLQATNIISGIIALIFIPGLCLTLAIFKSSASINRFGFSLLFGLLIQSLNVLLLYSIGSLFFYNQIDFKLTLILLSFIFVILTSLISFKRCYPHEGFSRWILSLKENWFSHDALFLYIIFIMSITVRLYYQQFCIFPTTDGCLYMDMARSLSSTGQFTSKIIDSNNPYTYPLGFNKHALVYFILALFFSIGGVSYFCAKLMAVFVGSLIVFPVYALAKKFYGLKVAIIATIIISSHPLLILFSSNIHGPEILGSLFTITSFYFFIEGVTGHDRSSSILSGLFAVLTLLAWYPDYYVLVYISFPVVAFLFPVFSKSHFKRKITYISLIFIASYIAVRLTAWVYEYWFVVIGIAFFYICLLLRNLNKQDISNIILFVIAMISLIYFYNIRNYYYPQAIIHPTLQHSITASFIPQEFQAYSLSLFLEKLILFWRHSASILTYTIVITALLSLADINHWKENFSLISFPLFFIILFIFLGQMQKRFLVSTAPFLIILSALTISHIMSFDNTRIEFILNISRKIFALNLRFIPSSIILMLIVAFSFIPQYYENINWYKNYWDASWTIYDPLGDGSISKWIAKNIPENAVLMARSRQEWTWITNRICVLPFPFNISLNELYYLIFKFKVNYLIVDKSFYDSYYNLKFLYSSFSNPPYLFERIYVLSDNASNRKVIIYNVTKIATLKSPLQIINVYPTDDVLVYERYPDYNYGNVTWITVGASGDKKLKAYLKFDLHSIPNGDILYASINLYVAELSFPINVSLSLIEDNAWNEKEVTWNNQPKVDMQSVYTFYMLTSSKTWITVDITKLVQMAYNKNKVISLCLSADYVSNNEDKLMISKFSSKESGLVYAELLRIVLISKD